MKLIETLSQNKKSHFWLFFAVLVILSLFMVYSYGLYPSHDFYFHFKRLNVLTEALRNGSFPIYLDHTAADGYGYATKWFYSDFVLIPFALVAMITEAVFAYQFMWFIMTVLCGIFMYNTIKRIYKNTYTAAIASILFTFCTYRLLDMYNRSAVGEALSFTFLPIVFLGLYEIIKGDYKKWYILTIGYSLMIFTHVLSSFLTFITLLIIIGIYYKDFTNNHKRIAYLAVSALSTIVITAYFLFPMLEQMFTGSFYYQTVVKAHPSDHAKGLNWIIWGMFGGIVHPKQIFIPGCGILLTWAISLRLFVTEKKSPFLRSVDIGVIIGLVYIVLTSSVVPWNTFPFNKLFFIQLPWRLYEFVSFFFALAGGYYLTRILKTNRRKFAGALMIITGTVFVISSSGRDFKYESSKRDLFEKATPETNNFHLYGMEYIPSKFPSIEYISERGNKIIATHPSTKITDIEKVNGKLNFDIIADKPETVELPLFYYKGYKAVSDKEDLPLKINESENGLVEISTNTSGHIIVYYGGTTLQKVSPFITIIGFILLCVYIIINRKRTNA